MKHIAKSASCALALFLAAVLLGGIVPLGVSAAEVTTILPDERTTVVLAEAYESYGNVNGGKGQLYVETNLGMPTLTA